MFNFSEGEVLLVDKPLEWTSFDVVNKIRYALKRKLNVKKIKVGHAGTLDPLATGLLIICTGKKTKTINELMGLDKCYEGIITLGATTSSYDLETDPINLKDTSGLSPENIQSACAHFIGELEQRPPVYSAKRVDGKKAYELARKGKEVNMKTNLVNVFDFTISKVEKSATLVGGIDCQFQVTCSKGTYIRSLAHDLGQHLAVGGFLSALRRTSVGDYSLDNALAVDQIISIIEESE